MEATGRVGVLGPRGVWGCWVHGRGNGGRGGSGPGYLREMRCLAQANRLLRPACGSRALCAGADEYLKGVQYLTGKGVEKDPKQAIVHWRTAADMGNAKAQSALGGFYLNQDDPTQASEYLQKASDQGHVRSNYLLGKMYANAQGVAQDATKAAQHLEFAAEQGMAEAQLEMGYIVSRLAQQADPAAQQAIFVQAAKWFTAAAEQESGKESLEAWNALGDLYLKGNGVDQSDPLATKHYRRAADQGDTVAQCNLATMIMLGRADTDDEHEAAKYFFYASEAGLGRAQFMMGQFCETGRGGRHLLDSVAVAA